MLLQKCNLTCHRQSEPLDQVGESQDNLNHLIRPFKLIYEEKTKNLGLSQWKCPTSMSYGLVIC